MHEEMKKFYLECDCKGFDHTICFAIDDDELFGKDLYVYATLQTHRTFWQRVRLAYRYIFRKDYLSFPYMDLMINERQGNIDQALKLADFLNDNLRPVDPSP